MRKPPWKWTGPKPLAAVLMAGPGKKPKPLYRCRHDREGWRCGKCGIFLVSLNLRTKCSCGFSVYRKMIDYEMIYEEEKYRKLALFQQERERTWGSRL